MFLTSALAKSLSLGTWRPLSGGIITHVPSSNKITTTVNRSQKGLLRALSSESISPPRAAQSRSVLCALCDPAFFDQPCRRREESPGGNEIVEPDGQERFT